jgi:hypothetical protein
MKRWRLQARETTVHASPPTIEQKLQQVLLKDVYGEDRIARSSP